MKDLWIKSKGVIAKIGLVDRFLILFMLILLLYTAIGIFTGMTDSQNSDMVDTIIRTSAASVFGYFISSNFTKTNKTDSTDESLNVQPDDQAEEPVKESVTEVLADQASCRKLQVIIVSFVGGCSLFLLFITKFFIAETSEISVTVSQLRDFVSACIGFLISYERSK